MKKSTFIIVFFSLGLLFASSDIRAQYNVYYGSGAGTGGNYNSIFGYNAGNLTTGSNNTFIGLSSGFKNTTGDFNVYLGAHSGGQSTTGRLNIYIGVAAGQYNNSGLANLFSGYHAGRNNTGSSSVFLGSQTGYNNINGSNNVFLGYQAGYNETGSNKLYIENSANTPLIYGDFDSNQVGINTTEIASGYAFSVKGKMIAEELKLDYQSAWPDYVFAPDYPLASLAAIEQYIKEKGHLPNIPSAEEVAEEGFSVGEMNTKLLEKVEELTLYLIQINKDIEKLKKENEVLRSMID